MFCDFLTVPWVGLRCVIVVFPDHTHLLFVQGDSTTYQLLHTYHQFCEAVDNGKEVRVVFCNISKAFDRIWHTCLLHKLRGLCCTENLLLKFSSYLSDLRQRVVLNGIFFECMEVSMFVSWSSTISFLY